MRVPIPVAIVLSAALLLPSFAKADPPAHAPAHGYRAKNKKKETRVETPAPRQGGIEVIFDSERGIEIAVGFPDVFHHDGSYYRKRDGRWQVSVTGDGGWRFSASSKIPGLVIEAGNKKKRSQPGPASRKPGKRR